MLSLILHGIAAVALISVGAYFGPKLRDWYEGAEKAAERLKARAKKAADKAKRINKALRS